MRTFLQKTLFVASLGVIASMFVGCTSDDDNTTTSSSKPTISSITVDEDTLTQTSASATIAFSSATQIYYVCAEGSSSSFSAGSATFESLEVSTSDKEVTLDFTDLVTETSYVIAAYAVNDDMETGVSTYDFTTPAEDVVENPDDDTPAVYAIAINSEGTELTLSVRNATQYEYHIYPQGEEPAEGTFSWIDEMIEEDGDYTVSIEYLTTGNYVIAAYASYYTTEEEGYDKISGEIKTYEFSYEMTVDSYFTIENIVYSPAMITFDVDVAEGTCNAIAVTAVRSEWYGQSSFTSMITGGTFDYFITEDTTINFCVDTNNDYTSFLTPNYSYTIAAVAVVESSSYEGSFEQTVYTYETRGSVWSHTDTTPAFEIGSSDAVVTIEEVEASKTIVSLEIEATQGTDATAYILGYTLSENVTSDVKTWIEETDYLSGSSYSLVEFAEGSTTSKETISGLTQGTEYKVFAIGITAEGYLGDVVVLNTNTQAIETNDGIVYSASVIPASYRATLEVKFGESCDKIYYCNGVIIDDNGNYGYWESKYSMTDEYASTLLTANMSTGVNYLSASDAVDGVASLAFTTGYTTDNATTLSVLPNNDYVMYLMGVDADGKVGAIQKLEYTTPELNFNAGENVTVSITPVNSSTNDSGNNEIWFEVEMGSDTATFIYPSQGINSSWHTLDSAYDYGVACLKEIYTTSTAAKIKITLLSSSYEAVVVPVDKYGRYGTPVYYKPE